MSLLVGNAKAFIAACWAAEPGGITSPARWAGLRNYAPLALGKLADYTGLLCALGAGQTRLLRVPFEDELSAAILFPGAFVVAGVYWTIFAKTVGIHTTGVHSHANKLFTQSQSTTFPE